MCEGSDETANDSADGCGTDCDPITRMESRMVWGWSGSRCRGVIDDMMDDMCFARFVFGRGRFAAVVTLVVVCLVTRLDELNFRAVRFASTFTTIATMRCSECCAANGESHDSGEDQLFDVLVHFIPSLS